MRVTMQHHIDIVRGSLGRNVLQSKSQSAADKIDHQRPLEITVAVSSDDGNSRTNCAQFIPNPLRANVAQMPDLIGALRKISNSLRQLVMGVCQHENLCHSKEDELLEFRNSNIELQTSGTAILAVVPAGILPAEPVATKQDPWSPHRLGSLCHGQCQKIWILYIISDFDIRISDFRLGFQSDRCEAQPTRCSRVFTT
jgi:hypothetical protein